MFFTSLNTSNVHIHYYIAKQNLLFPNDVSLKQGFLNEFNSTSFNSTSKLSNSKLHSQQTIILLQITSTPRSMQQFFFRRFSKPSIMITNHHSLIRSLRDVHKRDLVSVLRQSIRHFLYSSSLSFFNQYFLPTEFPYAQSAPLSLVSVDSQSLPPPSSPSAPPLLLSKTRISEDVLELYPLSDDHHNDNSEAENRDSRNSTAILFLPSHPHPPLRRFLLSDDAVDPASIEESHKHVVRRIRTTD